MLPSGSTNSGISSKPSGGWFGRGRPRATSHILFDPGRPWISRRDGGSPPESERMVHDLRALMRVCTEHAPQPTAVIFDARVMQPTPESGGRAGDDGHGRWKSLKLHMAVDTRGHLLVLKGTAANEQERAQVSELAAPGAERSTAGTDRRRLGSFPAGCRPGVPRGPRRCGPEGEV